MNIKQNLLYVSVGLMMSSVLNAQQVVDFNIDTALKKYTFIKGDSSSLQNDSIALASFYQKLFKLKSENQSVVSIAHIGDSHIQADHFSGVVRQHLQIDFGNAGRGLIFPYRLAKSNEPWSYKTTSTINTWEYKRCVFPDKPLPVGLSGYTLYSTDTAADISLFVKPNANLDYSFTKLTLFHEKQLGNFDLLVTDSSGNEIGYINMLNKSENNFTSTLRFETPQTKIKIKVCPRDTTQKSIQLYGMCIDNGKPGVLYNMIGVNGAEYNHFNKAQYFQEQFKQLNSDLIIVSLGTNEGFNYKSYSNEKFYKYIDSLIVNLKKNNPNACFILTTPGDSFKKSGKYRVKNPTILEARNTIIAYAQKNNLAYWDWFAISGGYGAMAEWKKAGMADAARIHYSKKGYEIQGELLYRALMEGYQQYLKNNLK